MELLTIYATGDEYVFEPSAIKIDDQKAAVVAFRSESSARRFMENRGLDASRYAILELTLAEFDKKRQGLQEAVPGLSVLIQIMD